MFFSSSFIHQHKGPPLEWVGSSHTFLCNLAGLWPQSSWPITTSSGVSVLFVEETMHLASWILLHAMPLLGNGNNCSPLCFSLFSCGKMRFSLIIVYEEIRKENDGECYNWNNHRIAARVVCALFLILLLLSIARIWSLRLGYLSAPSILPEIWMWI